MGRYLRRYLPVDRERRPVEIRDQIDMDSFRLDRTFDDSVPLQRGTGGKLDPKGGERPAATDDREFGKRLFDLLFEEFWRR